ncbi:MAG: hypothetical protein E6J65_27255 [Deltaproteobacteria bacterium]|nr:MAG: hypothetical protein E6J63_05010 [Deltaproteobacteria bacterium]TMB11135.1 MAG: hypothetical protein E6J65_27255 [Deltaproteobacteria bacterium]
MLDHATGALFGLILFVSPAVLAGDPVARPENVEHRLYLAPGLQFGAFSQELSLSVGRAKVKTFDAVPGDLHSHGGGWTSAGLRLTGVAHSWSPAALHALLFLSFGVWSWEWWPFGLELAVGGGGNAQRGYGLLQLSYIAGITSRFELVATAQWLVGENIAAPEGFSRGIFGVRYGFDLVEPRRERVIRVPETRDQ